MIDYFTAAPFHDMGNFGISRYVCMMDVCIHMHFVPHTLYTTYGFKRTDESIDMRHVLLTTYRNTPVVPNAELSW